jgi:hypothetical protein
MGLPACCSSSIVSVAQEAGSLDADGGLTCITRRKNNRLTQKPLVTAAKARI